MSFSDLIERVQEEARRKKEEADKIRKENLKTPKKEKK